MKSREFAELVREAAKGPGILSESDVLLGIALHSDRRVVTKAGAIAFIRWQALTFGGTWDSEELNNCAFYFRRVDVI